MPALKLVLDERGDEIERRPVVGPGLDDSGLEGGGHARDAQLAYLVVGHGAGSRALVGGRDTSVPGTGGH